MSNSSSNRGGMSVSASCPASTEGRGGEGRGEEWSGKRKCREE